MTVSSIGSLTRFADQVSNVGETRAPSKAAAASSAGADFGTVFAQVATEAIQTVKAGETTAISGLQGGASVQEVVQAVMSAEQTLHVALSIRDKAVSAYQEISRMQI